MPAVSYIFYPGGDHGPITLGDDAIGDRISGGLPQSNPEIEQRAIANSAHKLVIEHINDGPSLTWTVFYDKQTLDAAATFRLTHPQEIPVIPGIAQGILQELLDDGTTNFLQNCSRPKIRCVLWSGQSVVFEYTVHYGRVTDNFSGI